MPETLAQPAGAANGHIAGPDGWHERAVANPTSLRERLGSECTNLQGLRELTVNLLDAITALGGDPGGRVAWDRSRRLRGPDASDHEWRQDAAPLGHRTRAQGAFPGGEHALP